MGYLYNSKCKYEDCGYCYNKGLRNGLNSLDCAGYDKCSVYRLDYLESIAGKQPLNRSDKTQPVPDEKLSDSGSNGQKTSRIDIVGSNGNDGSHYLVEKVAKVLADDPQDWELYVDVAIQLIGMIKDE